MATNQRKHHEPLIHISKRDNMPGWKAWLIRLGAILLGFLVIGILSSILTEATFKESFQIMFKGVFGRLLEGKTTLLWKFLKDTAILLCLALAVTPAFRMRFWNCGAEGQALVGGLAAMICMIELGGKVPDGFLIAIIAVASILAGAVWGFVPAIFKAYNNYLVYGNLQGAKSAYNNAVKDRGLASGCIRCGQCEAQCPQQINIIERLQEIAKVLEA